MAKTPATDFEKPRGISRVEVRRGFAQVHVSGLTGMVAARRLEVLRAVADASVSLDFVKLTTHGISFLVAEGQSDEVAGALESVGCPFSIGGGRSIVLVYAVNMRDEEGLIAGIVRRVISSGVRVDHLGDMHDRVLLVVETTEVERVLESFADGRVEVQA